MVRSQWGQALLLFPIPVVEQIPTSDKVLVTLVRVEYNGAVLGDSPKAGVLPDGTAEYDFSTSFEYSPDGPNSLDVLVQKPLLLTVLEVVPKEKKKPERITPLGQAVVDLLPLLQGTTLNFTVFAPLYAVSASPSEIFIFVSQGGLEVTVSTKELLLSATQFSSGNLLSITLEAVYSVPDAFTADTQQNCMVCLQIPAAGEKEFPLLFKNGILKADGKNEPLPRPKHWPLGPILAPDALNIPNSFIVGGPYEDEDGELTKSEVRKDCASCICFVPSLKKRIAQHRHWPVELCRMSVASAGKGKTSKMDKGDEDKQIAFHGVAYVNMMHLLCPGVKQIRGAFRVFNYQDKEVFQKTRFQHSVFQDRRSQLSPAKEGLQTSPASRAAPSKALKEEKDFSATVRSREAHGCSASVSQDTARHREQCLSPQQYSEAGTFLVMEIKLDRPLVPKRLREELVRRVKELLPLRPALPRRTEGAKKAVEDYHKCITSVAVAILREYHELFGKQLPDQGAIDRKTLEEQKCQLDYELNTSGKYFAFKEQLKYSVVKIVREKYLKTTAFETQEQLQSFLSELYVYLVDNMHIALNKVGGNLGHGFTQLLLFAREAEANKDYQLASLFYKQVREPQFFPSWLDYGAFCYLHEDATKAQECYQQALCLDPHHIQSLLVSGIVAVKLQHYEEAEIFFEDACCLEPSSIVAWTLSGLFYELQNNYIRAERSFREAKKLLRAQLEEERKLLEAAEGEGEEPSSPSTQPGAWSCVVNSGRRGEVLRGEVQRVKVEGVDCELEQNSMEVPNTAQKALPHQSKGQTSCLACYERVISFVEDAEDIHFVYLRLGSIYLEDKEYGRAKQIYLLACDNSATCLTWLGVGIACYRLEEMLEAEDALSEANALDNTNPEVWGYLALICLQVSAQPLQPDEMELGLQNDALLQEIRAAQHRYGFGDPSL
uniref:Cilia and flagella associated protein 70 n=1 Tax=Cyanoderma ruficeps TaxID=181631 RepID=A0A8C3QRA0_9PASS